MADRQAQTTRTPPLTNGAYWATMNEAATIVAGPSIYQHQHREQRDEQCDPLKGMQADKCR